MLGYIIIGGVLTVTVVIPAISVGLTVSKRRLQPKLRGRAGESKVNSCLRKFRGKAFARFKDVMLPVQKKTAQIDNILVSPYGVFVIEMKNYTGVIKGGENQYKWIQSFPGSKVKPREFYNPVWQNEGHIKALRELLKNEVPNIRFHNVVVFSNECDLPLVPGVVKLGELKNFIKDKMKCDSVLSVEQVTAIKGLIAKNNIKDRNQRSSHVVYAKESAFQARSREKAEVMRNRAVANKDAAVKVQQAYALAKLSLNEQIREADQNCCDGEPRKFTGKKIER